MRGANSPDSLRLSALGESWGPESNLLRPLSAVRAQKSILKLRATPAEATMGVERAKSREFGQYAELGSALLEID